MWACERSSRSSAGSSLGRSAGWTSRPRAELDESTADADSRLECRIGEDPDAMKIDQHRRMAEPGDGEPVVGPLGARGAEARAMAPQSLRVARRPTDRRLARVTPPC